MTAMVRAIVRCDGCGAGITGGPDDSVQALRNALHGVWAVGLRAPSGIERDVCPECIRQGILEHATTAGADSQSEGARAVPGTGAADAGRPGESATAEQPAGADIRPAGGRGKGGRK